MAIKWKPHGHTADKCPGKNKNCSNCGEKGHVKTGCPKELKEGTGDDGRPSLAETLTKMNARLDKIEGMLKEGSVVGDANLAITHSQLNADQQLVEFGGISKRFQSEDEMPTYGGVRF